VVASRFCKPVQFFDDFDGGRLVAGLTTRPIVANRAICTRRSITGAAVVLMYAGLALWSTWPLLRNPATTLPLGPSQVATVPLFNLWTIWWNADRLRHGLKDYWDAPIFYPERDTFANSEPQPATMIVAPVIWTTGSRALAFNLYLWLALVLNGIFAERLMRTLGLGQAISAGGGAAMVLLPIVHWQLDVMQLVPLWGILWTWTALIKTARRPTIGRGVEIGAAFGMSFLACGHQGLLLAVLLTGAAWTLPVRWRQARLWLAGLAAVVVAAVLVGPVVARLHHVMAKNAFTRTPELVSQLSATPGDYTAPPGKLLVDLGPLAARPFWRLSPGWLKVALAAVGIVYGASRRRWRRWTAFFVMTAVLGFLLSLGTNLRVGGWEPWWTLTKFWPGLAQVRNVFRFAFFVQMAVVLLGAQGLYALLLAERRLTTKRIWRIVAGTVLALTGLFAVFETRPEATNLRAVPDPSLNADWIDFLRNQTPQRRAVACLPFARGDRVEDYEVTTWWMYFGTFHHVPQVDGYSGFFPSDHFQIRIAINHYPLTDQIVRQLADKEVEFLVVDRSLVPAGALGNGEFEFYSLKRVFEASNGIEIYRLESR
jgi:hypothetical protein